MPGSGSCPTVLLPNTTSVADFGLWAKAGAATNVAKATMVARVFMSHLRVAVGYRWDRVYTARDKPAVNCVTSVKIFWTSAVADGPCSDAEDAEGLGSIDRNNPAHRRVDVDAGNSPRDLHQRANAASISHSLRSGCNDASRIVQSARRRSKTLRTSL